MRGIVALSLAAVGLLFSSAANAETPSTLSIADPDAFATQLREMGYEPDPFDAGETPSTIIHSGSDSYVLVLGGCTVRKNCKYAVVLGTFSDLKNPPADWVAKKNVDFDFIKVWVNDSKLLTYSTAMIVNGMSRATFRASIDLFAASSGSLAREALAEGMLADQKPEAK